MNEIDFSLISKLIKKGKLVVYPTDTLYAIGADIYNKEAVANIFNIKHRPFDNPLPIALSSKDEIETVAYVDKTAQIFIDTFLPGKVTLVLKKKNIPDFVTAGKDSVAIRIPRDESCHKLLSKTGPLTATSANIHGKEVPSTIKEIKKQFEYDNRIATYIDSGKLYGKPSTVVDITDSHINVLREGIVTKKEIEKAIEYGRRDL